MSIKFEISGKITRGHSLEALVNQFNNVRFSSSRKSVPTEACNSLPHFKVSNFSLHGVLKRKIIKNMSAKWKTNHIQERDKKLTKCIKKTQGLVVYGSPELFQICRVQCGRGKAVSLVKQLEMTLGERVRKDVYKPLKMFNSKHASELSGANIRNQWLRLVKARL